VRRAVLGLLAALVLAGPAAAAEWEPYPMPPPPGGEINTPAGYPGDLDFWAPNRGLMTVGGNNAVPEGIYSWDGVDWHQLAIVCGGGTAAQVAWAGPREFWTITRPSLPRREDAGLALCHFKDGAVVGSFSTPNGAPDPYAFMTSAVCRGPNDCWFGGIGAQDGTGERVGAFHLHWDGQALRSVYNPQGRAVSDLLVHGGELFESTYVGGFPTRADEAELRDPEDPPRLLHRIVGETFVNDPFTPAPLPGVAPDATELLALDAAGGVAWAVGGGANSGPRRPGLRPPLAARLEGGVWEELTITGNGIAAGDVFWDVAAIPGTRTAWASVKGVNEGDGVNSDTTRVALIGENGLTEVEELVRQGDPRRGAAVRVACPAPGDCWLATARGFLFRHGDAGDYERDTDPAFQGLITGRPNEAAEQSIPDTPPEDDSRLHAPPLEIIPEPPPASNRPCDPLPSAIARVQRPRVRGSKRLEVRFRLRRRAQVRLLGYRGKRVVARTKTRTLRPGPRKLVLRVSRKRWPTRLRFVVRDRGTTKKRPCRRRGGGGGGGGDNTVTTGPGDNTVTTGPGDNTVTTGPGDNTVTTRLSP
jgi:hypothetical protein